MGKARDKKIGGGFLNLVNLALNVCIVVLIVNIARTNASTGNSEGLSEATAVAETVVSGDLNESVTTADLEPFETEPNSIENEPNAVSEVSQAQLIDREQSDQWDEVVRMRVTAYCPCAKCCGEYSDGMTACGHTIQPGDTFVAADGRYSFGTEMLIPGYSDSKPVKVLDRGGAIKGNKLDVFFHTHQEALEWGVKFLDVKINHK